MHALKPRDYRVATAIWHQLHCKFFSCPHFGGATGGPRPPCPI